MKEKINVFFASDDRYLPYLAIALTSLSEHACDEYIYNVNVLTTGFSSDSLKEIKKIVKPNVIISVCDISDRVSELRDELRLRLRDYYSESIYYRLFIPSLFPEMKKAVYLDCDLVLCDDVANLFNINLGNNLIGAVTDESVMCQPIFRVYVKRQIGLLRAERYINSGVLLMNLDAMRESYIEEKFTHLLVEYNFNTVAPDQDYLNFLCKGRIMYLPRGWNKHPIPGNNIPEKDVHIMHYNMFNKPWHYDDVPYEHLFWNASKKTPFHDKMLFEKESYSDDKKFADMSGGARLLEAAKDIFERGESMSEAIRDDYFTALRV